MTKIKFYVREAPGQQLVMDHILKLPGSEKLNRTSTRPIIAGQSASRLFNEVSEIDRWRVPSLASLIYIFRPPLLRVYGNQHSVDYHLRKRMSFRVHR